MKIKDIIISWDFILSLATAIVLWIFLPFWISNQFTITLYEIGISVLSIIFSVFFAALAIIISSSDDDFVRFLEETGDYTAIINTFKYSLTVLFIALLYSIILTAITSYWINLELINQQFYFITIFSFLFFYGLFATFNSTYDAIVYSKFRTRYLNANKKNKGNS